MKEISIAEYEALCLSLDKARLQARLKNAKSLLQLRYRKMFKPGIFKPKDHALYSDSPFGYRLQWQTRRNPELPESYENQQTSAGVVYLEKLPAPKMG
jgi:hypothetical protein